MSYYYTVFENIHFIRCLYKWKLKQ